MNFPLIVGIESSCDETGVGVVSGSKLLANVVSSSIAQHVPFGGVVPEIAARAHVEAFVPTLQKALEVAGITLEQVDAFAVTTGPGLASALVVGVSAAKALSVATGKPLYAVNHLVAHVAAGFLDDLPVPFPTAALLVSGGHTEILRVDNIADDVQLLGATLDDAAGEAYDKVARLLGLDYPGGAVLDDLAKVGDPKAIVFPRGLTSQKDLVKNRYNFSFSGLKTSVARWVEQKQLRGEDFVVADVAASFQEAVADVLTKKTILACKEQGLQHLLLGGGVAANSRLRDLLQQRATQAGIVLRVPKVSLCTDNGAMVAALGAQLFMQGCSFSGLGFSPDSGMSVSEVYLPAGLV